MWTPPLFIRAVGQDRVPVPMLTQPGRSGPGRPGYRADPDGRMRLDPVGRTSWLALRISRTSSPWLAGRPRPRFPGSRAPRAGQAREISYREDDESTSSELAVRMVTSLPISC
jgi:hypothetical protein